MLHDIARQTGKQVKGSVQSNDKKHFLIYCPSYSTASIHADIFGLIHAGF